MNIGVDSFRLQRIAPWLREIKNSNISKALVYAGCFSACRSLWANSILSVFVYQVASGTSHQEEAVGIVTSIRGISQLLSGVLTGIALDGYCRRVTALKLASVFGVIAGISICVSSLEQDYSSFSIAIIAWGLFCGMADTTVGTMLVDITNSGQHRTKIFTKRKVCEAYGTTIGPSISCAMFIFLGDDWSAENCAFIIAFGQCFLLPALFVLCSFDEHNRYDQIPATDIHSNRIESDPNRDKYNLHKPVSSPNVADQHEDKHKLLDKECMNNDAKDVVWTSISADDNDDHFEIKSEVENPNNIFYCLPKARSVAGLVAFSDCMLSLALGLSISYFPVLFSVVLQLPPALVQCLYIIHPICQTRLSPLAQRLSETYGRCQVASAFRLTGIVFMFSIIGAYYYVKSSWLISVLFIIRSSFMNSTRPLTKSVLMDAVPREERGRWTALETINTFTWSGSALVGGFIIHRGSSLANGIMLNFFISGMLQLLSIIPLIFVFMEAVMRSRLLRRKIESDMNEIEIGTVASS